MEHQEKFSLRRIIIFGHHVDKLKSFYAENFNFAVTEEVKDQWIVLNTGQAELAIHKTGTEYEPEDGKGFSAESNTKLVFYTNDNIESIRQRFLDKGVTIGNIKSFEGIDSLFCDGEDPEGNVFQIEQRLSIST